MARAKHRDRHSSQSGSAGNEFEMEEHEMVSEAGEAMSAAQRHTQRMQNRTLAAFEAFDIFSGPMVRVMDQNRMMLQKLLNAMQEESLRFVNRRLEHTSHAIESSRECHGVSGLMAVHQEWMLDCARDYAEQTKRFAELMRELAEDGTATLSEVSSSVMERGRELAAREHHAAA